MRVSNEGTAEQSVAFPCAGNSRGLAAGAGSTLDFPRAPPSGTAITLEERFRGNSPGTWRASYAGAFDWGPDVGRGMLASAYLLEPGDLMWPELERVTAQARLKLFIR